MLTTYVTLFPSFCALSCCNAYGLREIGDKHCQPPFSTYREMSQAYALLYVTFSFKPQHVYFNGAFPMRQLVLGTVQHINSIMYTTI